MSDAKLDLTALSDALGEDERPAITGESKKTSTDLSAIDSPDTLSPSSAPSPVPVKTNAGDTPAVPARQAIPIAQPTRNTSHPDPNVQNIKAMFPDIDTDTIQAVLAADGGNFEQAINTLLQMSDPTYVPPPPFQRNSQQEQDEQLARSLAAQEQEGVQQNSRFPSGRGGGGFSSLLGSNTSGGASSPSYDPTQLTYQPRVKRTTSGLQAPPSAPQNSYFQNNQQYDRYESSSSTSPSIWPGPKEAKEWQNDINRFAETGFAKAASTFSALRQRGEKAFTGLSQQQQQQQNQSSTSQDQYTAPASGWSSRKPATMSNSSTFSPTIGSGRGFDKDPAPVGENELAKILARGREDNKKASIVDRYKNASRSNSTNSVKKHQDEDDDDALGWDDAGRTGNEKEREPIKISDNSVDSIATKIQDQSKLKPTASPRNAVSLMEGSAGRGVTSPHRSSSDKIDDINDDDDDGNDLEYVSNPFEDED